MSTEFEGLSEQAPERMLAPHNDPLHDASDEDPTFVAAEKDSFCLKTAVGIFGIGTATLICMFFLILGFSVASIGTAYLNGTVLENKSLSIVIALICVSLLVILVCFFVCATLTTLLTLCLRKDIEKIRNFKHANSLQKRYLKIALGWKREAEETKEKNAKFIKERSVLRSQRRSRLDMNERRLVEVTKKKAETDGRIADLLGRPPKAPPAGDEASTRTKTTRVRKRGPSLVSFMRETYSDDPTIS